MRYAASVTIKMKNTADFHYNSRANTSVFAGEPPYDLEVIPKPSQAWKRFRANFGRLPRLGEDCAAYVIHPKEALPLKPSQVKNLLQIGLEADTLENDPITYHWALGNIGVGRVTRDFIQAHFCDADTLPAEEKLREIEKRVPRGTFSTFDSLAMGTRFGFYMGDPHTFTKTGTRTARLVVSPAGNQLNQTFTIGLQKEVVTR